MIVSLTFRFTLSFSIFAYMYRYSARHFDVQSIKSCRIRIRRRSSIRSKEKNKFELEESPFHVVKTRFLFFDFILREESVGSYFIVVKNSPIPTPRSKKLATLRAAITRLEKRRKLWAPVSRKTHDRVSLVS